MYKIIVIFSLIFFFVSSITFSVEAQDVVVDETYAMPEIEGDTLSIFYYEPSLADLAMDSLKSLPNRVVIPDSIMDNYSIKILIAPIRLNKVRLEDSIMVTDATKEDFTNLGMPEIVYTYFLQEINDYNFRNRVYEKSAEEIAEDFKNTQSEIKKEIKSNNLEKKRLELVNHYREILSYFEEKENNRDINKKEIENLISIYTVAADNLHLVDGIVTTDILVEKELDSFSEKYLQFLQFMIDLANVNIEIHNFSPRERVEIEKSLKRTIEKSIEDLREYHYK